MRHLLIVLDTNEYIFGIGAAKKPSCERLLDLVIEEAEALSVRIVRRIIDEVESNLSEIGRKTFFSFISAVAEIDEDHVVPYVFEHQYEIMGFKPADAFIAAYVQWVEADYLITENRHFLEIGGYDVAAFLAHQSVEKLLKSIYAVKGEKIPRTHYIDELAKRLHLSGQLIDSILELTVDYTFSRYPDVAEHVPYEEYTKEIAEEKVKIAKEVFRSMEQLYQGLLEEK